jgi:hypothetical protein
LFSSFPFHLGKPEIDPAEDIEPRPKDTVELFDGVVGTDFVSFDSDESFLTDGMMAIIEKG